MRSFRGAARDEETALVAQQPWTSRLREFCAAYEPRNDDLLDNPIICLLLGHVKGVSRTVRADVGAW